MIYITTLDKLDKIKFIDKRHVLWWQLGFEGRKILSEEEFNQGLKEITYNCYNLKTHTKENQSFKVWTKDFVPILLRKINLGQLEAECLFSIKPLSHEYPWLNLEETIKKTKELNFPVSAYNQPHIRGIVVESTNDFLFWNPVICGVEPLYYDTSAFKLKTGEVILVCPIHPTKFYKNLVKGRKGRISQRKFIGSDLSTEGFKIVPYYEFDQAKKHATIYPAKIFNRSLDLPIIIKGNPSTKIPEIVGAGSFYFGGLDSKNESITYKILSENQRELARQCLMGRL